MDSQLTPVGCSTNQAREVSAEQLRSVQQIPKESVFLLCFVNCFSLGFSHCTWLSKKRNERVRSLTTLGSHKQIMSASSSYDALFEECMRNKSNRLGRHRFRLSVGKMTSTHGSLDTVPIYVHCRQVHPKYI